MQSFIFLCKPCICHTESSQVKQLNPLCHSAHLFWDQSWPAGSAATGIPSLAWMPLAVEPVVPGMDQQLLQTTLRHLPPSCAVSPGAVTAGTASWTKWHWLWGAEGSLCETSFSQYFQFSLVCPVSFLEFITISALLSVKVTLVGCSVLGPYTTRYLISLLGLHFPSEWVIFWHGKHFYSWLTFLCVRVSCSDVVWIHMMILLNIWQNWE